MDLSHIDLGFKDFHVHEEQHSISAAAGSLVNLAQSAHPVGASVHFQASQGADLGTPA